MDSRPTWTDCDEGGGYVVPNVLSPRDLVSRPDIMDETVPHIYKGLVTLANGYVPERKRTKVCRILLSGDKIYLLCRSKF